MPSQCCVYICLPGEITLYPDTDFTPRVRPMAGPRSFWNSYPSTLFPPGRPSHKNLQAICLHSIHRPRYPFYSPPLNGGSDFRRRAEAVNRVESWYSACCHGNGKQQVQEVTLCCVTQAVSVSVATLDSVLSCCVQFCLGPFTPSVPTEPPSRCTDAVVMRTEDAQGG